MELFNEYYNSEVRFLQSLFSFKRTFSEDEAIAAAKAANVYAPYNDYKNVINKWIESGLIEHCGVQRYQVSHDPQLYSFAAPLNSLEAEYLSDICDTKEASLFLDWAADVILSRPDSSMFDYIKRQNSEGKQSESTKVDSSVFRTILAAIYEKQRVEYDYRTNASPVIQSSTAIPYRLEHSVFDGRWWLISYSEAQDRTIKSRLENIKVVKLCGKHNVTETAIRSAILRHVAPEPVVLRIADKRNALERCLLNFEDMLNMTAYKLSEKEYELRFKYFDWDQQVIVRKLMYLGENVVIKSPATLVDAVIAELQAAIIQSV